MAGFEFPGLDLSSQDSNTPAFVCVFSVEISNMSGAIWRYSGDHLVRGGISKNTDRKRYYIGCPEYSYIYIYMSYIILHSYPLIGAVMSE